MAECSEIGLLLSAFEDGELEPHEMQEVARHLAQCSTCERELAGYALIGRELRALRIEPDLSGFTAAVTSRIRQGRPPLQVRVERALGRFGRQLSSALPTAALTAAIAILTAVLVTPYAGRLLDGALPNNGLARLEGGSAAQRAPAASTEIASAPHDSHAVISRLESSSPSVAVWSEPHHDTTVIWLPDQP
jgi:anti-sigma factor RsiW